MGLNVKSNFCQNMDKDKRRQQHKNMENFTFAAFLLNRYGLFSLFFVYYLSRFSIKLSTQKRVNYNKN